MEKPEVNAIDIINETKKVLDVLLDAGYDDDILGAKAIETGIKLATRLCILRLRQLGMSHGQISRAEGIHVSPDTVSSWYAGEYVPDPPKFKALVELYTNTDDTLWRARQIKTLGM